MAVAVQLDFAGTTLDQYDQVIERMGLKPGGRGPSGLLFHWSARTPDGLHVTDVWESREVFDKFNEEQIIPFTKEAGIAGPPQVQFQDVHNYLTAG